jgi:C3HC4-type zinc finger (RING finger) protein
MLSDSTVSGSEPAITMISEAAINSESTVVTTSGELITKDSKQCVICFDRERSRLISVCGHYCMCEVCSLTVLKSNPKCPICRSPFEESNLIKVHIP